MSSTCSACGNINFHPQFTTAGVLRGKAEEKRLVKPSLSSEELVEVLPQSARVAEEFAIQNQNEWQLWARVTENFADQSRHLAYLSFATRNLSFDKASERYKQHRRSHFLVEKERWQADLADEMLEKIASLCLIQFERRENVRHITDFERWAIGPLGMKSKIIMLGLFLAGVWIAFSLILVIFLH